jgi:hypothetical protein
MELAFSQQFCSVVPVKAGGNLNAGPKRFPCLVQVGDGELVITEGAQTLIDRAQVGAVELLDGPWLQRKVGEGTFLRMNGREYAVDFGQVSSTELARTGPGGVLKAAATAGGPKSLRTARELSKAFAEALVSQGVIDRRKAKSRS